MSEDVKLAPYPSKSGRKSGKGIKQAVQIEAGDMNASLDIIINTSVQNMGRPSEYPATAGGLESFIQNTIEYFEYVKTVNSEPNATDKNYIIPDVESWAIFLGISRQTLWTYSKRGGQWQEVINYYKDAIGMIKKQLALHFKVPPVFSIFDLVNNHGYLNSSEFKAIVEREDIGNTSSKLDEMVQKSGLIWDEKIGEYIPMRGGEI